MMDTNPDGITLRVQQVLEKAGFKDRATQGENTGDAAQEPQNESEARTKDQGEELQRGQLRQLRQVGLRRASVRGFHSFRTTRITLALSNGVPMEVVRMVTGHETVEIVLKHYFRPGPEQFRAIIHRAMPELLVGKGKTREEEMLEILRSMTGKTWKQGRKQLTKLLEQARPGSTAFKTMTASRRAAGQKGAR